MAAESVTNRHDRQSNPDAPITWNTVQPPLLELLGPALTELLNPDKLIQQGELWHYPGKIIAIPGGASGIGEKAALLAAGMGFKIAIADKDAKKAQLVKQACSYLYGNTGVEVFPVDLGKTDQVIRVVSDIKQHFGGVDYVAYCAGTEENGKGSLSDMPLQDAFHIMEVNNSGPIAFFHEIIPLLRNSIIKHTFPYGGAAVIVASINGGQGHVHEPLTTYQPTKAFLDTLAIGLGATEIKNGVRVFGIDPGATATEGMGRARMDSADSGSVQTAYNRSIPEGCRAHPLEIAYPMLTLLSPLFSYLTGTSIVIDGGFLSNFTPPDLRTPGTQFRINPDEMVMWNGERKPAYMAALDVLGLLE